MTYFKAIINLTRWILLLLLYVTNYALTVQTEGTCRFVSLGYPVCVLVLGWEVDMSQPNARDTVGAQLRWREVMFYMCPTKGQGWAYCKVHPGEYMIEAHLIYLC